MIRRLAPLVFALACGTAGDNAPGTGSAGGSDESTSTGSASMSSTSAPADESSSSPGSSVTSTAAESSTEGSSSSEGSSSGDGTTTDASSESTGAPVDCDAEVDPQQCFQQGCVWGTGGADCRAPFDDAQCGRFDAWDTCLTEYCDWHPETSTCSANVTGDCAGITDGYTCIYSQCIHLDDVCYEPGTVACNLLNGVIECFLNLCNFNDESSACE